MEDRLHSFETALGRLFPGGDLDATLRSLLQNPEVPRAPSSKSSSRHSTPAKHDPERAEPAPEALPQQADGFDWAEKEITLGDLTDGMAALSIKPEGAGYFGWSIRYNVFHCSRLTLEPQELLQVSYHYVHFSTMGLT